MRRKEMRLSSETCGGILSFLWQWKLATTATLAKKFYTHSSVEACYKRLQRLEKGRYVQSLVSRNGKGFVWALEKKGFQYLKDDLPELAEEGYLSESPGHDLIVLAAQLGCWIDGVPSGWQLFTEQQLRRFTKESYPEWVPRSKIHRPDGYWYYSNGSDSRLLAVEVELNQKALVDYETVGRFYRLDTKANQVIWITGKRANPSSIQEAILKSIKPKENIHSFISLDDFLKHHWQSKICIGKDTGKTFAEALVQSPSNPFPHVDKSHFYDIRKFPRKSVTNQNIETHRFFQLTGAFSL